MITSASNQKIKHISSLLSSKKERTSTGSFVIEGTKIFIEAPKELILEVYISESFEKKLAGENIEKETGIMSEVSIKLKETGFETLSDNIFKKVSDTVTPQGILCIMKIRPRTLTEYLQLYADKPVKIVALEELQDPGNMGTIVRTAEAAGIDFILASENTVDVYSSKVVRSTMGCIFRLPVIYSDDLYKDIDIIKSNYIKVYAAHLKGENSYSEVSYDKRSMILIGNEGRGLTDKASSLADTLVKIPMHGKVESLNASVAAAILMYETCR